MTRLSSVGSGSASPAGQRPEICYTSFMSRVDDSPSVAITVGPNTSLTVTLVGEFDLSTRNLLQDALSHVTDPYPHVHAVTVDLSGVTFFDSMSVGFLVQTYHVLKQKGVRLRVANASTGIDRILQI